MQSNALVIPVPTVLSLDGSMRLAIFKAMPHQWVLGRASKPTADGGARHESIDLPFAAYLARKGLTK